MVMCVGLLAALAFMTGGLGSPFADDEVPFEVVRRDHFDALAVQHSRDQMSDRPLVLKVQLLGGADPATLEPAARWLEENVNVRIVPAVEGAPLYLTEQDLSATSGRATLGATLRTGMAVEVGDPRVAPCVLVHEVLHFLGLRHVEDERNIMSPHCRPDKLERATIWPSQVDHVAQLKEIRAATPRGSELWAHR